MDTSRSQETTGQALMVAGSLLLGTLGVFVHESGQHPLMAVWARCAFGALALGAWALASGRLHELRLRGRALGAALAAGGLMVLNWSLFFAAMAHVPIGLATLVVHAQPFWVMALAALWLHEPVGRWQAGAAAAAMLGLVLASGVAGDGGGGLALGTGLAGGLLMCLAASFTYAVVTLIAKGAAGASPLALAWWQCLVGTVLLAGWPLVHGLPTAPSAWAWLAGLGVLHTGLAYVLMYEGMARLPAERIAVLQFVYPGAALLVDWAVYGQALGPLQSAGVGLMAVALWASRSRPAGAPGPRPWRTRGRPAD
ncbi:DMT family transporter [Aquincola tertiaricarbonis]|uniref:DMT family transporter n=1 Tax=Aquincola tertiaricarbonis TaxID=391953 RepID=UPI00061527D8|nr:DMT family transporter [Aquincola tertiaricarbonis]